MATWIAAGEISSAGTEQMTISTYLQDWSLMEHRAEARRPLYRQTPLADESGVEREDCCVWKGEEKDLGFVR